MTTKPVWIVDDDASIRFVLEKALERAGFATRSWSQAHALLDALQAASDAELPAVVVSDIRMPGLPGLELLQRIKAQHPQLPIIIMTAFSDLQSAVGAFAGGAFEYLAKPFDVTHAVELIDRAARTSGTSDAPTHPPGAQRVHVEQQDMLGQSPAMQEVFRAIGRLSQSTVSVLITGESGSGKELVAHALHRHSPRRLGPFVAINTAAIPRDLLESELFGHERGAFTGAQGLRRGRFEQAATGTLFLDEIGDMPTELQTRLLRVLSEERFYRVGGTDPIASDVRIIAATHQDLEQRVKDGLFREDLFHRLNVIRLRLPPLRERRSDIPMLARHFLGCAARQLGVALRHLSAEAMEQLTQFDFPGNVRQLSNLCQWLTVMAPSTHVERKDLPPEVLLQGPHTPHPAWADLGAAAEAIPSVPAGHHATHAAAQTPSPPCDAPRIHNAAEEEQSWEAWVRAETKAQLALGQKNLWSLLAARFERAMIQGALEHTGGKKVEAAARLGMGRNTMTRKFTELGL